MNHIMLANPQAIIEVQTFPPAFQDNPWAYGFALFGLLIMAAISTAQVVHGARNLMPSRNGWRTPVTMARLAQMGLFTTILTLTFPDLAILLLWNEINANTMVDLWSTDRFFDGLSLVPFLASVLLILRGRFRMVEQLIRPPLPMDLYSSWPQIRRQLSMIGIVALVAAGCALGKMQIIGF